MEKREWTLPSVLLVATAVLTVFFTPGPSLLYAQVRGRIRVLGQPAVPGQVVDDDAGPANFTAPDRKILQALKRAQKAVKDARYGEALEDLGQVLRCNEDYFFQPDPKLSIFKSMKAEAQQLLGQMPREGLDLYEVRNGAEARDKLNRAIAAGDDGELSEISAQLFHTEAGYEATYLHALHQMDHGAPLAAALTLKRLHDAGTAAAPFEPGLSLTRAACFFQAGMPADCRQVLIDLKRRLGRPGLQLAGREIPWFSDESDAPAWLAKLTGLQPMAAAVETDRWAMFRGDPSRNASTVGGAPLLSLRWHVPVSDDMSLEPMTDDPTQQKALPQLQNEYHDKGVALFSGLHPLAVGDRILMRTMSNVLAIDFQTGKRIWQTDVEKDPVEPNSNRFNNIWIGGRSNMSQPAQYGQRIWDDATYGTLSSDGRLVFVIEGLPLTVNGVYGGFVGVVGRQNDPSNHSITNKLVAYDIFGDGKPQSGGKHKWELGGQESLGPNDALFLGAPEHGQGSRNAAQIDLSDAFFLGPPLPLRGQLYVMVEIKGEIRLVALDGATGIPIWSQQLCMVESNVMQDPIRRLAGVSPSYSDGVLVCPTGSGCVVAVDLATHSLLWGHVYSHAGETNGQGRRMRAMQFQGAFVNSTGPMSRWLDGTAMIVNGRVLLTPAEADALYCLDLADGRQAWEAQPRGDHYYIACVHKGVVVLVGRNSIDAIKLEDGKKAWDERSISLPAGAGVCGHGCYVGGQYLLPLSSGEVMAIDLESGKVAATVKSRRSSTPGNLLCYRGRVISQGLDGLELYYQVDAAREEVARLLAANPNDVEGLTLRGEMLLDAGKSAEAVADFRRAYNLDKGADSHGRTRELLRDALLAGLRDDFAAHRGMAEEVESLLDSPGQRATYYRYMAGGLHRAGQWPEALEYYLKLVDLEAAKQPLERIERSYLVRRDCWVRARLGELRRQGGAAVAAALDRALEPRLEKAKKDAGLDGLRHFLAFFGDQPQAAPAREELLRRLAQAGQILEAEMLMAAAVDSTDRKAQAALLADMADLNFRAGRVSDAAACVRQLRQEFADVPCHAGKTPDQWLAALADGDALRREVELPPPAWPVGEVEASKPDTNETAFNHGVRYDVRFGGPAGPFFADSTVSFDFQQEVRLRDGLGRLQKPVRLIENGRVYGGAYNPFSTLARSCGHLLVVSVGTKICALDPWGASGKSSSIVWGQDLTETSTDNGGNMVFINNGIDRDFRVNPFGPINARYVCFMRRRNIVAVDPVSGEPLWERQDAPRGCEVFGDERYMFVLAAGSDEASVYRTVDGQLLGTRKVPSKLPATPQYGGYVQVENTSPLSNAGMEFLGRYILTWQGDYNGHLLGLFDPWEQKAVWPSRKFDAGARISMVGSEAVGVLEPSGRFVLVALADGHAIADLKLEARPHFSVTDIVVSRMGDQYIVLAHDSNNTMPGNVNNGMQPTQGMISYPISRARIYALDLKGKPSWPAPVDVDHQYFLLSQPGRLPVLVFAAFQYANAGGQFGQMSLRSSLVAIDRRTGRIVYDNKDHRGPMRGMGVEIHGDPSEKTVRISTNNETVNLTFTDKPVKSVVRASTGVQKPRGKLGEALLDAIQGGVEAIGSPQR